MGCPRFAGPADARRVRASAAFMREVDGFGEPPGQDRDLHQWDGVREGNGTKCKASADRGRAAGSEGLAGGPEDHDDEPGRCHERLGKGDAPERERSFPDDERDSGSDRGSSAARGGPRPGANAAACARRLQRRDGVREPGKPVVAGASADLCHRASVAHPCDAPRRQEVRGNRPGRCGPAPRRLTLSPAEARDLCSGAAFERRCQVAPWSDAPSMTTLGKRSR